MGLTSFIAGTLTSLLIGNTAILPPRAGGEDPAPAVKVLLPHSGATSDARLSPAGDRIIFRTGRLGQGQLLEKFKDGRARRLAADARHGVWGNPRFSPDGLYVMLDQVDPGSRAIRRTVVRSIAGGDTLLAFPAGGVASWGPDGKRIAFAHPGTGVMVVDFPSGRVRRFITTDAPDAAAVAPTVEFSPNGDLLAVVDQPRAGISRLRLVRLKDGKSIVLTRAEAVTMVPFWSQDGRRLGAILFGRDAGPNATTIAVWNARKPRALPKHIYSNSRVNPLHQPAFSPDGKAVAFVHKNAKSGTTDVYALPVAGGRPARLTRTGNVTGSLRWARSGRLVLEGGTRVLVVNR